MISFRASLCPNQRKTMIPDAIADSSRKRNWEEVEEEEEEEEKSKAHESSVMKRSGSGKPGSSVLDMELHLEAPLPVEWQRCLDIQSGEVHFHDAMTNKRTCKGPSKEDETTSNPLTTTSTGRRTVSLNLELNLQPYDDLSPPEGETTSPTKRYPVEEDPERSRSGPGKKAEERIEEEEEEEEMVATVCVRCHMLVMLCVSRPSCPNCKFLYPPDHTPFTLLFKPPKCTTQLLC